MSLFWNLNITKGQGTGNIGSQKSTFIMLGFVSCILLLLGWRISFNNNIFLLHFSVWCKKVKGNGEREQYEYSYICPFLLFPTFRSDVTQRLAVAFILTYSYWHTGRYCRSVKFNNGTFYESLSCWSDVCVKMSIVFYTDLCPCLVF